MYNLRTKRLERNQVSLTNDEPNTDIKSRYKRRMFELRLKRLNAGAKRRYFWLHITEPLSYVPWKRSRRYHYRLMRKIRSRAVFLPKRIPRTNNDTAHQEMGDFDERVQRFCQETDLLALHRITTMFPEASVQRKAYELADKGWKDLWSLSSAGPTCLLSSADTTFLHPGCVFFSKAERKNTPIVVDTGASTSVSPFKEDFVRFTESESTVTGIGAKAKVEGHGIVRWTIYDSNGKETTVETEAIYMPSASIRLYSPQAHFRKHQKGSMYVDHRGIKVLFPHEKRSFCFPFHEPSVLPLMLHTESRQENRNLYLRRDVLEPQCMLSEAFETNLTKNDIDLLPADRLQGDNILSAVFDERNLNLTGPQHELLAWHYRWGHVSMRKIQRLIRPGDYDETQHSETISGMPVLKSNFKQTRSCVPPQCASCNLAKASRTPIRTASTPCSSDGSLKDGDLKPGDCISMDQIVCPQKGRTLSSGKGTITGGTIFVDHASGFITFFPQSSASVVDTLVGKHALDREAHSLGFKLRKFLSDNGIFKAKDFLNDLRRRGQTFRFSGVGAKHQNGIAENSIKTVSNLARSMLIHSALRWPDAHDLSLWPLCLEHAIYIWNKLPGIDGMSPEEKWTSVKSDHRHLRNLHPWGCPTYVLHPTLQDGKKLPKWKPRSRQGKFVGYSPIHASSVALILNRETKRISPQFHLLFDDFSTTVRGVELRNAPDLLAFDWDSFIDRHGITSYYDEDDPIPPDTWEAQDLSQRERRPEVTEPRTRVRQSSSWLDEHRGASTHSVPESETDPGTILESNSEILDTELAERETSLPEGDSAVRADDDSSGHLDCVDVSDDQDGEEIPQDQPPSDPTHVPSTSRDTSLPDCPVETFGRGQRARRPNRRYYNRDFVNSCPGGSFMTMQQAEAKLKRKTTEADQDIQFINSLDWGGSVSELADICGSGYDASLIQNMVYDENDTLGLLQEMSPLAFAARASAADTPRWNEALHGPNSEGFWEAMYNEIATLNNLKAWEVVPRTAEMTVLPSTWAFRIKRFPTGLVRKLKARICVMGNRQVDVDPFECFAPVVAWSTVRMMLLLSVILNLHTVQVDYTSAFCQAPVKEDIFVTLPRGWKTLNQMGVNAGFEEDHVLKLRRSLYGLRQSPKNFYDHLKERLESIGFRQSKCDSCLFLKGDVTCLVYVDDCLFFSRTKELLDDTLTDLKDADMELSREDDVAGFLGVLLTRNEDGTITLSQTGLIKRIVDALGLTSANGTRTPAQKSALPRDINGEAYGETFNYASVVGMMMYLACNSRPDIAFAVHQCARHTHQPTSLHAKYLKQIGRYLKRTEDKGMQINPMRDGKLHMECYADADFAGLWGQEDAHDPHCVRSRTGYIIMLNKCPILWKSQLQTEIAMSTMEAEYVALSAACRDVLPLIRLTTELGNRYGLSRDGTPSIKTTIYEDNEGALKLANTELPRMTPRSKHYGVKYHWFREHVQSGLINVLPISTKDQLADIFTKGLPFETFERLRKLLMGW